MSKMIFEQGSGNKKGKKSIGFYVTSVLCICAVGVAGWSVFGDKAEVSGTEVNIPVQSENAAEQWGFSADDANAGLTSEVSSKAEGTVSEKGKEAENNKALSSSPEKTSKTSSETKKEEPADVPFDEALIYEDDMGAKQVAGKNDKNGIFTLPVTGEIIAKFSGEELVYNEALGDWRVHNGIDIAAEKGIKVKTAAAGKVIDIYSDELNCATVVIRHSDNITAYYSGLNEKVPVKKNAQVTAGTVIGSVAGVPGEGNEKCHIHLAVKKDGAYVDPVSAMGFKF